jgi:hypothetical protein
MQRLWLSVFLCAVVSFAGSSGATQTVKPRTQSSNTSLAKSQEWMDLTRRVWTNSDRSIVFHLRTSWIPGENHRGMFRYILTGVPQSATSSNQSPDTQTLMTDIVNNCSIYLVLSDADQFELRNIKVPLNYGADDAGRVQSLYVNSSVQMDASEYRSLLSGGGYDISWKCYP